MNDILLNISAAAIITAVFKMLVPDERHGKQINLLISCFFIVSVINIFKSNSDLIKLNDLFQIDTSYADYSVIVEKQTADETANALRARLYAELEKENISPEKIYIDINISESGSISISKIRLVFPDISTQEAERAVDITGECVGYEITVELEEQ